MIKIKGRGMKFFFKGVIILPLVLAGCSGITDGLQHDAGQSKSDALQSYSITIENFSPVTYTRDVEISVNPGEASEMRFSNNLSEWSAWESAAEYKEWILPENSSMKRVYAEFRKDGAMVNSASDEIEFIEKLLPPSPGENDKSGSSVAISSDGLTAVVGGENHTVTTGSGFTYRPGSVIIYRYDGIRWNPAIMVPDGASDNDRFGASVSISSDGTLIAVGSPGFSGSSGRVILYRFNTLTGGWDYVAQAAGGAGSCLGYSVALSGNGSHLLAGGVTGNSRKGEAILYSVQTSGLSHVKTFSSLSSVAEERFGCSVSLNNDASVAVIGAEQKANGVFTNNGAVYLFRISGASYVETELSPGIPGYNLFFGCSVSVSDNGDVVCAGAKGASLEKGRVYLFRYNSPVYSEYIVQDDLGAAGDQFGYSAAVSGDGEMVITGSPYADTVYPDSGKLMLFEFNGSSYAPADEFLSSDPYNEKHLGTASALSDSKDVFIGGAIKDIYNLKRCGTSYVFRR